MTEFQKLEIAAARKMSRNAFDAARKQAREVYDAAIKSAGEIYKRADEAYVAAMKQAATQLTKNLEHSSLRDRRKP